MDDSELQRIRAARLAQLQASGQAGAPKNGPSQEEGNAERHAQLSSLLEPAARDRLRRIALVKPPYAAQIESMLLSMARSGRIRQRVTEQELVAMLTDLGPSGSATGGSGGGAGSQIRNLRRNDDDSDDDF